MRIVLDTNVLVSGLLNPYGSPAIVIGLMLNEKIKLLYDNRILMEYSEVLRRKKFKFKSEWAEPLIDFIRNEGDFIIAEMIAVKFKDEDDKKIYEVAVSGKADYIVTGNRDHFPVKGIVKTSKEFINIYTAGY